MPSVSTMCRASPSWSRRRKASNARARGRSCPRLARTRSTPTSRRATPRRCANGRRWGSRSKPSSPRKRGPITTGFSIAKKDDDAQPSTRRASRGMGPGVRRDDSVFRGKSAAMTSALRPGIITAVATVLVDQASKLWLLYVFDLGHRVPSRVQVTPFFDLELAWNIGISFGWLQNDSQFVQYGLMAVKALAVVALAIWMARSQTPLATIALGLIIGGAIGNAIDRLAYGAVVDFALFHVAISGNPYYWYVFNLADSAIVAGVFALLYDSFFGVGAAKAP